jgi:chemotaxis protein MotB
MAKKAESAGAPAWMATFADLMALMMCFFVLLFSFSQIDESKYRLMVESMAKGFGAQQVSMQMPSTPTASLRSPSSINSPFTQFQAPNRSSRTRNRIQSSEQASATAKKIKLVMREDIADGKVSVETKGNTVLIRLPEEVAFPPGSDVVSADIAGIIDRLAPVMRESTGTIMVSGHSDNQPISSSEFASNWELSADRAVAVIHEIVELTGIEEGRFAAVGHGSTKPIAPNDTPENRARNRRVEITIVEEQG